MRFFPAFSRLAFLASFPLPLHPKGCRTFFGRQSQPAPNTEKFAFFEKNKPWFFSGLRQFDFCCKNMDFLDIFGKCRFFVRFSAALTKIPKKKFFWECLTFWTLDSRIPKVENTLAKFVFPVSETRFPVFQNVAIQAGNVIHKIFKNERTRWSGGGERRWKEATVVHLRFRWLTSPLFFKSWKYNWLPSTAVFINVK